MFFRYTATELFIATIIGDITVKMPQGLPMSALLFVSQVKTLPMRCINIQAVRKLDTTMGQFCPQKSSLCHTRFNLTIMLAYSVRLDNVSFALNLTQQANTTVPCALSNLQKNIRNRIKTEVRNM